MTRKAIIFLTLVAVGGMSPAGAASGAEFDVKCLLVSNLFSTNATDANARELANSAKLFYGGRVSGLPNARVEAAINSQRAQIGPENAAAAMNACAQNMERALNNIQAIGQKLQPRPAKPA